MRELGQLRRNIFAVPIVGGPIVHAVEIDAGRKYIGVARKPKRSEISAVTAAPQAKPHWIYVRARLQIFCAGNNILIFGGAASGASGSFAKGTPVADAAAVVHGKNDVTAAGEILVHGVGI